MKLTLTPIFVFVIVFVLLVIILTLQIIFIPDIDNKVYNLDYEPNIKPKFVPVKTSDIE